MPVYTYHCENCDHQFEKYQSFSEDALTICPECEQSALLKVYKPALVVFKGSGFYVTDKSSAKNASLTKTSHAKSEESKNNGSEKKTEKSSEKKSNTSPTPE